MAVLVPGQRRDWWPCQELWGVWGHWEETSIESRWGDETGVPRALGSVLPTSEPAAGGSV